MLDFETENALLDMARKYDDYYDFECEVGWMDWMEDFIESDDDELLNETEIDSINNVLKTIFEKSRG